MDQRIIFFCQCAKKKYRWHHCPRKLDQVPTLEELITIRLLTYMFHIGAFKHEYNGLIRGSGLVTLLYISRLPLPEVFKRNLISNFTYGRQSNQRRREVHHDIYRLSNDDNNDEHVYSYVGGGNLIPERIYERFGEHRYRNYIRIYNCAFKYKHKLLLSLDAGGIRRYALPDWLDVNVMVPTFSLTNLYPLYECLKQNVAHFINTDNDSWSDDVVPAIELDNVEEIDETGDMDEVSNFAAVGDICDVHDDNEISSIADVKETEVSEVIEISDDEVVEISDDSDDEIVEVMEIIAISDDD